MGGSNCLVSMLLLSVVMARWMVLFSFSVTGLRLKGHTVTGLKGHTVTGLMLKGHTVLEGHAVLRGQMVVVKGQMVFWEFLGVLWGVSLLVSSMVELLLADGAFGVSLGVLGGLTPGICFAALEVS